MLPLHSSSADPERLSHRDFYAAHKGMEESEIARLFWAMHDRVNQRHGYDDAYAAWSAAADVLEAMF